MRSDVGSFIEQMRRQQLVQATIQTVAELGYGQASLARIAARAGVSKGVIAYHFDTKERLIELVVEHVYASSWAAVEPHLAAADTAAGKLQAFVHAEIGYYSSHREQLLAVASIVVNHRAADGSLRYPPGAEQSVLGVLMAILRAGQASGELQPFDPLPLSVTVDRAITGALEQWAADPSIDLQAYAVELGRIVGAYLRALTSVVR
jgi:AcrR family transcriptional regulator